MPGRMRILGLNAACRIICTPCILMPSMRIHAQYGHVSSCAFMCPSRQRPGQGSGYILAAASVPRRALLALFPTLSRCQAPGPARHLQILFLAAARLVSSRGLGELFGNYPRSNDGVRECCPDALLLVYRQTPRRPLPHRAIHMLSLETHSRWADDSVRQDAGLRCVGRDRLARFPTLSRCHISSAEAHFVIPHDGADYSWELLQHCSNGHR